MEDHLCMECGEELHGRRDKKFCNESCRSSYHNRLNAPQSEIVRAINRNLNRNRKILRELFCYGKRTVRRSLLLRMGFDFELITEIRQLDEDSLCYFCYEFGYTPLDEQSIQITEHKENRYI